MLVSLIFPILLFALVLVLARLEDRLFVPPPEEETLAERVPATDEVPETRTPEPQDAQAREQEGDLEPEQLPRYRERVELTVDSNTRGRHARRVGGSTVRSRHPVRRARRRAIPWRRVA